MKFTDDCVTQRDKIEYCHIALEKHRLAHNIEGKRFRDGEITLSAFRKWWDEEWHPRNAAICAELNKLQSAIEIKQGTSQEDIDAILLARAEEVERYKNSKRFLPDISAFGKVGRVLEKVDPTEDFTTYTEADPGDDLTVTATKVTAVNVLDDTDSWVYDDKGVDHFDGDFEFLFDWKVNYEDTDSKSRICALSNQIDQWNDIDSENDSALGIYVTSSNGNPVWYACELDSGAQYFLGASYYSNATQYYCKFKRDESVGTYGTLYTYFYTDSDRTSLHSSGSGALHTSKKDYRYISVYLPSGHDNKPFSFEFANLDLQEPVATNMQINIGDSWKTVTSVQINIGDVWKAVTKIQQNIGDAWKDVF